MGEESRTSNDTKIAQIQIHYKYKYNTRKVGRGKKVEEGEDSWTSDDTNTNKVQIQIQYKHKYSTNTWSTLNS